MSESKSCLQKCGQGRCIRCDPDPTKTHVQLRVEVCTGHTVLCTGLEDVRTTCTVNTD